MNDDAQLLAAALGDVSPLPDLEVLRELLPDYELFELCGRGGMGQVYRARHRGMDREVALKLLIAEGDEAVRRFTTEARALAKLDHPNIVRVYDYGEREGLCFLAMAFIKGMDLRERMRDQDWNETRALACLPALCSALQYAHQQGIVHRDIKPENILVSEGGQIILADFGLARVIDKQVSSLALTQHAIGTPHYMAPEQIERPGEVDHRADIYAFGVLCYEMLTGELPIGRFEAPSHKAAIRRAVDAAIMRSLEKDPARRWPDIAAMQAQLEHIERRWWGLVLVLAVVGTVLGAVTMWSQQRDSAQVPVVDSTSTPSSQSTPTLEPAVLAERRAAAERFMSLLRDERFSDAAGLFTPRLAESLSPTALAQQWRARRRAVGTYQTLSIASETVDDDGDLIVTFICHAEQTDHLFSVAITHGGLIAALWFGDQS